MGASVTKLLRKKKDGKLPEPGQNCKNKSGQKITQNEERKLQSVIRDLDGLSVHPAEEEDDYVTPRRKQTEARSTPYPAQQALIGDDETVNQANQTQNTIGNLNNGTTDYLTLQPYAWDTTQGLPVADTDLFDLFSNEDYQTMASFGMIDEDCQILEDLNVFVSNSYQQMAPSFASPCSSGYQSESSTRLDCPTEQSLLSAPSTSSNDLHVLQPVVRNVEIFEENYESGVIANEFYEYIVSIDNDRADNVQIFTRAKDIFFRLNTLSKLERLYNHNDTMLMIFIANKDSAKPFTGKLGYSPTKETVFRLASIYNLVARFAVEKPSAIEAENDQNQSALHLAANNCPDHPLLAAYIAEKLQQLNYDFTTHCTTMTCRMHGLGNLLHCLVILGDSHAEVLRHLLKLERVQKLVNSKCNQEDNLLLTPLHLAIKEHTSYKTRADTTVRILVLNGAKLSENWKLLADQIGMDKVVQLLLDFKASIDNTEQPTTQTT